MNKFTFLLFLLLPAFVFAQNNVFISKQKLELCVIGPKGDTLLCVPCAMGSQLGQKKSLNDECTPEGTFCIVSEKKQKRWAHPANEAQSQMEGGYATTVITMVDAEGREACVHGSFRQQLIGARTTSGCILLAHPDMRRLAKLVNKKSVFHISSDVIPVPVVQVVKPKVLTEEERLDSILKVRGGQIVDTTRQFYGYDKMVLDIKLLQRRYPEVIRYELRDTTYQGRAIPVVYLGGKNPRKKIMVQAAMHAREYITSPLVMSMIEHYAKGYHSGSYGARKYSEIFDSVSLVIMPMANPDGVEIAQRGAAGTTTEEARQWIQSKIDEGKDFTQIKSNARGVDINRNFENGFDYKSVGEKGKDLFFFMGDKPYSEVETRMMMKVARENDFSVFLNYHTRGQVVYWGCQNAKKEVNDRAQKLAELIEYHTGYRLIGPKYQKPCGSWADDVETIFERPSATIEVGTQNPVPISEFQGIYRVNIHLWADLCQQVLQGDI